VTLLDATRTDPAALYVIYLHGDDHGRPGLAEAMIKGVRDQVPQGAAVLDRSGLYPRETLAGTVKSVRLVDAVIMIAKPVRDTHSSVDDQRIDLDTAQREIAELALDRGVAVLIRTRNGSLVRIEQCHRTDRQGGMRLVPPTPEEPSAPDEVHS
jgi:hypothetical protein